MTGSPRIREAASLALPCLLRRVPGTVAVFRSVHKTSNKLEGIYIIIYQRERRVQADKVQPGKEGIADERV